MGFSAASTLTVVVSLDVALLALPRKSAVIVSTRDGDPTPEGVYIVEQSALALWAGPSRQAVKEPDPELCIGIPPLGGSCTPCGYETCTLHLTG
jgi:hypothetical protein